MNAQMQLPLIPHETDKGVVYQRASDGYINATALCQSAEKNMGDYLRLISTKGFLEELSSVMGIPVTALVIKIQGGNPELQGSWVHPKVAIHLGQWASPKFAVAVSTWVDQWLRGDTPDKMPYHLRRYVANRTAIPHTHFSVLNEMIFGLIAPLESEGYELPENMLPDISQGKMFSNWLRKEKGVEPKNFPSYKHRYEDGREVDARLYPNSLLEEFRAHFNEVWIPQKAHSYFKSRDEKALEYLPKLLG